MTATYQSIGAKVDGIVLHTFDPKYVPLATSNFESILLQFRAHANLSVENQSPDPKTPFRTYADIFIPVVLLKSSIDADEFCRIIRSRLFDKAYVLSLRSLIPLSNVSSVKEHELLSDAALSSAFAKYFSPDSTTVPAFIYTPGPTSKFLVNLTDVLRPMT